MQLLTSPLCQSTVTSPLCQTNVAGAAAEAGSALRSAFDRKVQGAAAAVMSRGSLSCPKLLRHWAGCTKLLRSSSNDLLQPWQDSQERTRGLQASSFSSDSPSASCEGKRSCKFQGALMGICCTPKLLALSNCLI